MAKYSMLLTKAISPIIFAEVREKYESLEYLDPMIYDNLSRYSTTQCINNKVDNRIHHESYNNFSISESSEDLYVTVDNTSINRLDIISARFYGYPIYWWVLALANDIIDPFDIPLGSIIRVPALSSLYETEGVLSQHEPTERY